MVRNTLSFKKGRCGVALGVVTALACGDTPTAPTVRPPEPPNVSSFVLGAALSNLDSSGHFRLETPDIETPYALIGTTEAEAISLGVIATWFANPEVQVIPGTIGGVEAIEEQHGGPIRWGALEVARRGSYFAESHIGPVPSAAGPSAIRTYGPQFVMPLFDNGKPVVAVSVSAYATNVFVNSAGFVETKDPALEGGGEFQVTGIPLSLSDVGMPVSPELATQFAFEQTGARVIEVPRLGLPGHRVLNAAARWRIVLEHAVDLERLADGAPVRTDVVYVGVLPIGMDRMLDPAWTAPPFGLRLFVAAEVQPDFVEVANQTVPVRAGYDLDRVLPR